MNFTTRSKLYLKKYAPSWMFTSIHFVSQHTLNPLREQIFRFRARNFTIPTTQDVTIEGTTYTFLIDPSNGYHDKQVYVYKIYEPHISKVIKQYSLPGTTCLDIGANIGYHTVLMSSSVGTSGHVHAFEPLARVLPQLRTNLLKNNCSNVTLHEVALSNKEGSALLASEVTNIGNSSIVTTQTETTSSIRTTTLDSLTLPKISFIKLDVEGHELEMLQGGTATILRDLPVVLFEFSPVFFQGNKQHHSKELLQFFTEKTYTLYDLEDNNVCVRDIDTFIESFGNGKRSQTNILALPS